MYFDSMLMKVQTLSVMFIIEFIAFSVKSDYQWTFSKYLFRNEFDTDLVLKIKERVGS